MLFLGAGDPIVMADAVRKGVEFRCHMFDVLIFPLGDLSKGEHTHAIQHALHHRPDPVNLFEIVFLGRAGFSCAASGGRWDM